MQKLKLRKLMQKEKAFLVSLSHGKGKPIIARASAQQLNIVSWILYYIAGGAIPIKQEAVDKLKASRKKRLLDGHFANRQDFNAFLSSRELQKTVLKHLSLMYPFLLKPVLKK